MQRESGGSELDNAGNAADMTITNPMEKQQWYFYNPKIVSQGVQAFKKQWGERELKDYWRFSNEISSLMTNDTIPTDSTMLGDATLAMDSTMTVAGDSLMLEEEVIEEALSNDPTTREYYIQQIPYTDEKKEAARKVKQAKKEGLIDQFIYGSISASYLADIVDSL